MTLDEARVAKRDLMSIIATDGQGVEHHGIIRQVGYHDSGRDDLVFVEGGSGVGWFPVADVRLHPRETSAGGAAF